MTFSFINTTDIHELETKLLTALQGYRPLHARIGYVAGIISAEGADRIPHNVARVRHYVDHVRQDCVFPVFASTDVFTLEVNERIHASALTSDHYVAFWRNILCAGYVTDVFMTPRWESSPGACEEHTQAHELGIAIQYLSALPEYP